MAIQHLLPFLLMLNDSREFKVAFSSGLKQQMLEKGVAEAEEFSRFVVFTESRRNPQNEKIQPLHPHASGTNNFLHNNWRKIALIRTFIHKWENGKFKYQCKMNSQAIIKHLKKTNTVKERYYATEE